MLAETSTSTLSLEAIIKRVLTFRQITPLDYQLLKSAILSEQSFSPTTQTHLDQLFESLQRGSIWIVP
ncbi:hypothetical protein VB834_16285 [Limnoraphis robusta Tam1]|jgi:hypothetical protein|uniref:Uncharacterized protein n=1 Tax=Limnoraphis robusta CCNP1315 TaxID=3110306 RepID=A0ABU5U5X9_9CYAN|nr:hypothetical protein [Limnoraphis robusta]MEA5501156.1 hypothetical protein [Limnoraphis robusta BA-68 BA1]MEA5522048.1 hypothetical protein [Limnoraphis robusta CCNP1315]MEA5540584.1 hypothetical protein [Limnoraphis robusta Tam1]MEA5545422.1 hypothetical protein [Limnoraphis robusta CCNP1324]